MESEAKEQEAMLEFMDIVGESADRARQYLQVTGWGLEEALQLYFAENTEGGSGGGGGGNGGGEDLGLPGASAVLPGVSSGVSGSAGVVPGQMNAGSSSFGDRDGGGGVDGGLGGDEESYVRPPLPVKREALYDDVFQTRAHQVLQFPSHPSFVDPFRNFEDEANQHGGPGEGSGQATGSGMRDSLAALYRPPLVLMFQGTFEQAKTEAGRQGKWLLVNLQSTKEFASYMLNRDTWAHEAVKDTVGTSFIFWQVNDDTEEGRKVCTYYKLTSMPTILVIDPLTGQKMRAWEGMISAERLLEDLVRYMDMGPLEKQPIPPQKRPREAVDGNSHTSREPREMKTEVDEQRRVAASASLHDGVVATGSQARPAAMGDLGSVSSGPGSAGIAAAEVAKPSVYPTLPEEPESKFAGICRVGIRYPDGSRGNRRFMKTDPLKYLWSFCSSQVKEAAGGRKFHLNQTVPGAIRTLDFNSDASLDEAGVSNSIVLMTWD